VKMPRGHSRKGCVCDACLRKRASDREYYLANSERLKQYQKEHYAAPENKAKRAKTSAAWRAANRESLLAKKTAYRRAHPNQFKEWRAKNPTYLKEWRAAHPASVQASKAARRLLENADRRLVTEKDWARLLSRYGGRCAFCGASGKMTAEHVVPLNRGGRHSIGNLLPACISCNSSKHDRLLVEWVYSD